MKKLVILLALASCQTPDPVFVAASREYYTAVNPEYLNYVDHDPMLTQEQKTRRHATADRFNEAIKAREAK
jgi:hypothetical protein